LSRRETSREKTCSRSMSAARVMAAGSVMNEPRSGTSDRLRKNSAAPAASGKARATPAVTSTASCITGRLAAITMMTNTNMGSTKRRESRYAVAAPQPCASAIATSSSSAHRPNTVSTSPSRCHSPACAVRVCARCSK
jgi:hypothetical protein